MIKALQNIKLSTFEFLKRHFYDIDILRQANEYINQLCGIKTFFGNEHDFSLFQEMLKPSGAISEAEDRREYGDFQTPAMLSDSVCSLITGDNFSPEILIEPTFGKGSFVISALKTFPDLKHVYGTEIFEPYCWQTKFAILELFIENPELNKPSISLFCEDIFRFDFNKIGQYIDKKNVLVIGNPPWVTNAELSSLGSRNLPTKSNFKSHNGLEAITGKGNFDIGEYIILMMLNSFATHNGYLAMLAKNSVIKNIIHDLPRTDYSISDIAALSLMQRRILMHLLKPLSSNAGLARNQRNSDVKFPLLTHLIQLTESSAGSAINLYQTLIYIKIIISLTVSARSSGGRE